MCLSGIAFNVSATDTNLRFSARARTRVNMAKIPASKGVNLVRVLLQQEQPRVSFRALGGSRVCLLWERSFSDRASYDEVGCGSRKPMPSQICWSLKAPQNSCLFFFSRSFFSALTRRRRKEEEEEENESEMGEVGKRKERNLRISQSVTK